MTTDHELRQENASRMLANGGTPPRDTVMECLTRACRVLTYLHGERGECPGCAVSGAVSDD